MCVKYRARDFYHTCYCLSGLSIAQHFAEGKLSRIHIIVNKNVNELLPTHPLFNIGVEAACNAHTYFSNVAQRSCPGGGTEPDQMNTDATCDSECQSDQKP